jgi:Calcineurin-like phosphoesterase
MGLAHGRPSLEFATSKALVGAARRSPLPIHEPGDLSGDEAGSIMKHPTYLVLVALPAALFFACAKGQLNTGTASAGSGGAPAACQGCVTDQSCAAGSFCGQFAGDTYCAPECGQPGQAACSSESVCTMLMTAEGQQVQLCVPRTNTCGGGTSTSSSGATMSTTTSSTSATSSTSSGGGIPTTCAGADGAIGCCTAGGVLYYCSGGSTLETKACTGGEVCGWSASDGYYACVAPPATADPSGTNPLLCSGSSGSTSSSSSSSTSSTSSTSSSGSTSSGGPIGPGGGTIPTLSFAVVGDTRPATEDDPGGYPTPIITKIWQDVQAYSPRPPFAISTGDYMFASPSHTPGTQATQLTTYLGARAAYSNIVFPAMGNHECDGATGDNCGPGISNFCAPAEYNSDNASFNVFVQKLLTPINQTLPYYTIKINGTNNAWTAKFVFVACNYWSQTQATWMQTQLAEPTTYTFIVRHEGSDATTAPCLCQTTPNAATIMNQFPYTLLIAGHTHTFEAFSSEKQIIVGNGGAPLSGSVDYGWVLITQQSNNDIKIQAFDYQTGAELPEGPITLSP